MAVPHLIEASNLTEMFAIIVTAGLAGLKLWVCLRNSVNAERARTRRLIIALRGVTSQDRADIIQACAALEAAAGTVVRSEAEPGNSRPNGTMCTLLRVMRR